jgi:uncharacterized protein YrzB (UPF0473 family)
MPTDPEEPKDDENGDGHVEEFDESEELDEEDLVTIVDDTGKELECAILAILEHEEEEFALLAPVAELTTDEGDEIQMFIFRYGVDEEGNQTFSYIEDEPLYEVVRDEFARLMKENQDDDEDEGEA